MIEPVKIGDAMLYLGDCLQILPTLRGIDTVITDPPYCSGGFQETGKKVGSIGTRADDSIQLDNLSTTGYRALIRELCRSTIADEFCIFTDWKMWLWMVEGAELGGVKTRNMIVWDKQQMGMGMPWRNQHELIYYGKRSPAQINSGKFGNVLNAARTGNVEHPTEKPINLLASLVSNSSGTVICDPFMGSGSTGVACANLGRPFIGIEIEPKYFAIACKRIAAAQSQARLFNEPPPHQLKVI
jgi:DNA modification methylase